LSITSFIPEIIKSREKSILNINAKFIGTEPIAFAFSFIVSSSAFFYCWCGSNWHYCSTNKETENLGK
jgi:hypothetical protein